MRGRTKEKHDIPQTAEHAFDAYAAWDLARRLLGNDADPTMSRRTCVVRTLPSFRGELDQ
jgi:hypothetical protein